MRANVPADLILPVRAGLSRRRFVQGLAAGGVIGALGGLSSGGWASSGGGQAATGNGTAPVLRGTEFDLVIGESAVNFTGKPGMATKGELAMLRRMKYTTAPDALILGDPIAGAAYSELLGGRKAVFVRTREGFEKRDVVLGQRDGQSVEIVSGLAAGEIIAVSNTFSLKAELSKPGEED